MNPKASIGKYFFNEIHAGYIPIYLFDFDTHQGSANNLPKRFIKRAQEMAALAKSCAEAYDFSDYSGER